MTMKWTWADLLSPMAMLSHCVLHVGHGFWLSYQQDNSMSHCVLICWPIKHQKGLSLLFQSNLWGTIICITSPNQTREEAPPRVVFHSSFPIGNCTRIITPTLMWMHAVFFNSSAQIQLHHPLDLLHVANFYLFSSESLTKN